jgi:hypothetical protein
MRLEMSGQFSRIIDIYVKDQHDRPIADAEITFSLNDELAGKVPSSGGHSSIRLTDRSDVVGVTAKVGSKEQTAKLAANGTVH